MQRHRGTHRLDARRALEKRAALERDDPICQVLGGAVQARRGSQQRRPVDVAVEDPPGRFTIDADRHVRIGTVGNDVLVVDVQRARHPRSGKLPFGDELCERLAAQTIDDLP